MYSPGSEILGYMQGVASKYKLEPYIKLRHELTSARYDEATGKWNLRIKRPSPTSPDTFEEFDDWADFVFNGIGVLNRWKWPEIQGLRDFKGTMVHSAGWDLGGTSWEEDVKDWGNKKIGVIGLVRVYLHRLHINRILKVITHRDPLRCKLLARWAPKWASCTTLCVTRPGSHLRSL